MTIPGEIMTIILSVLPLTELRASIPIAMAVYKMTAWQAVLWSLVGSGLGAWLLLRYLEPVTSFLRQRSGFLDRFFNRLFEKTRAKAIGQYVKYGQWALVIFVAVPLPGTGFWTGSLIAFLFNIPLAKAWPLIFAGLAISALLVALAALGVFTIF